MFEVVGPQPPVPGLGPQVQRQFEIRVGRGRARTGDEVVAAAGLGPHQPAMTTHQPMGEPLTTWATGVFWRRCHMRGPAASRALHQNVVREVHQIAAVVEEPFRMHAPSMRYTPPGQSSQQQVSGFGLGQLLECRGDVVYSRVLEFGAGVGGSEYCLAVEHVDEGGGEDSGNVGGEGGG